MIFKVTEATNFLRVFCLPDIFPSGYCFGGGHPSIFMMVDWFNAFPQEDFWSEETKEVNILDADYQKHIEELKGFIKEKMYFNPTHTYMVLTDYGDVFLVNPEKRADELQKQLDKIKKSISPESLTKGDMNYEYYKQPTRNT